VVAHGGSIGRAARALRPHRQRLQARESLLALHAAAPLQVLWEDDGDGRWMVAVKPAGMGVLQGRRSLANALLALQASRYEGAGGGGDGGGGAGGDEQQPQPQPQQPWTAAYDGPMRVAIFRGAPPLETLDACGLANVSVKPTACLWIRAVRVEGRKSSLLLPTPERFARLFEREEAVCQRRDCPPSSREIGALVAILTVLTRNCAVSGFQ